MPFKWLFRLFYMRIKWMNSIGGHYLADMEVVKNTKRKCQQNGVYRNIY